MFQFTPLREGRPVASINSLRLAFQFQFTPLREGRQKYHKIPYNLLLFQFTPLREGRQGKPDYHLIPYSVSIHAPARGATVSLLGSSLTAMFQFTPLREGRRTPGKMFRYPCLSFNSRPCERGDSRDWATRMMLESFNSRPCERGDFPRLA